MPLSDDMRERLEFAAVVAIVALFAAAPFLVLSYFGPAVSLVATPLVAMTWFWLLYGHTHGYALIRLPLFMTVFFWHLLAFGLGLVRLIFWSA
jgi:hypothetical protein